MVSGEVPKEDETMRQEEVVRKNISLVFDFLRYLTDHPEMVEEIPEGCELEFLDGAFPLIETENGVKGVEKAFCKVEHTFHLAI